MQRKEKERERLRGVYQKRRETERSYAAIRKFLTERNLALLEEFDAQQQQRQQQQQSSQNKKRRKSQNEEDLVTLRSHLEEDATLNTSSHNNTLNELTTTQIIPDESTVNVALSDVALSDVALSDVALSDVAVNLDTDLDDCIINSILSTMTPHAPLPILTPELLNSVPELNETPFENELALY